MSVENLSAVGIVTAAVLYMLAFLAHAVEWASVRGTEHPPHRSRHLDAKLAANSFPGWHARVQPV